MSVYKKPPTNTAGSGAKSIGSYGRQGHHTAYEQNKEDSRLQPGGLRVRKQVSRGPNPNMPSGAQRVASRDRFTQGVISQNNAQAQQRRARGPSQGAAINRVKSQQKVRGPGYSNQAQQVQQAAHQKYGSNKENNIQGDVVNYLKDELLATWEAYLIPDYHRTVFLDCIFGLKPQQYSPIIVKEIEDLQNEKSPIQNTIRAIIARESCISQIMELEKVLRETDEKNLQLQSLGMQQMNSQNQQSHSQLLDECLNILHSLRMLSLHVVKCIIEWRKQLIYNFLLTNNNNPTSQNMMQLPPQRNNLKKFKNIPFVWENENYLLKMKSDTSISLYQSHFARYINFSNKNDPFLVYPSIKQKPASNDRALVQGGGMKGIKNLKGANQQQQARNRTQKLTIPLQNQLMKIIRQCEVYLMEEAVTDQIIKTTQMQIDPVLKQMNEFIPSGPGGFMQIQGEDGTMETAQKTIDENIVDIQTQPIGNDQIDEQENEEAALDERVTEPNIDEIPSPPKVEAPKQEVTVPEPAPVRQPSIVPQEEVQAKPSPPPQPASTQEVDDSEMSFQGWTLHENDYANEVATYLARLDQGQRDSFAPLDKLIANSLDGYDLTVMVLAPSSQESFNAKSIGGLVIFNQDSAPIKSSTGANMSKIVLQHVSAINISRRESLMDLALEHIWKLTHCHAIRVNLYHLKDASSGQLKADPEFKGLLKAKKFKWKTVQNDMEAGTRSEILELQNLDFQSQMVKSKASIYREGLQREDILKEPVTIYFSSMVAFGREKNVKDLEAAALPQIQSQANIVASLMVYKNQINKATATQADTEVVLQLPKLSDVPQDEQQGFIADISAAIAKHEDTDGSKDQEGNTKPKASCILPKTTFEFERSTQLAKIKAIRGLSPNKDIEVKLSDKSCSLLATKVNFDFRFKAIDQSSLKVGGKAFNFMRIRQTQVFKGASAQFKEILILNSIENDVNFVILIPHKPGQIKNQTMHDNVKASLKNFQETSRHMPGDIKVWLPQFKIGSRHEGNMVSEEQIKNYKVENGDENVNGQEPIWVQAYFQQSSFELFSIPHAAGNLVFDIDQANDIVITEEEFFVAVTVNQIENSGIDLPLCVTRVTSENWRSYKK